MVERVYLVFEALAALLCLHGLYNRKFHWSIYTILYLSFDFIFYQIGLEYGGIEKVKLILHVLLLVYVRVQFKGTWKVSIINYILNAMLCSILQLVTCLPMKMLNIKNYPNTYYIANISLLFVIYVLYKVNLLSRISLYMQQKGRMVVFVLIILASFLMFSMCIVGINSGFEPLDYYLLVGSIIMLFLLLYYLQKERLMNKQMIAEKTLNSLYGSALTELMEKVRMNQHDYKNQLTTIQGMAYTAHSIEELRKEQEKYYKIIEQEDKYYNIISGNDDSVIAGFLYSKLCNVDMEDVQINCSLKVHKIENILLVSDIVKILGILIDNAFEEISKEEYEKKAIDIEVNESEDLKIKVGNVCHFMSISETEKCFKKGHSSKGEGRGFGLYSVSEIVRRWKGTILPENVEQDVGNWFYITVELPKRKRP